MKMPTFAGNQRAIVFFISLWCIVFLVVWGKGYREHPFIASGLPILPSREDVGQVADTHVPQKEGVGVQGIAFSEGLHPNAKIQVAVLLDVSNSMDGLIGQAKAQLWNMVNLMGDVRCEGLQPQFELALYEYGRSNNEKDKGYVKQLHPFTTDLDAVSNTLFNLSTNGGEEYCPDVIVQCTDALAWDESPTAYKVIFIAGNESFRQGPVSWTTACAKAMEKKIIVNTIYCGTRGEGLKEYWDLGAECGNGKFTIINQDGVIEDIATPYDSMLIALNERLNATYVAYGTRGEEAAMMQAEVDKKNFGLSMAAGASRVEAKARGSVYKNESWDLVDAMQTDSIAVMRLHKDALPESMRNMSKDEIVAALAHKAKERGMVQKKIAEVSAKRNEYINRERQISPKGSPTLQTEMEKIIREQVQSYNMKVQ